MLSDNSQSDRRNHGYPGAFLDVLLISRPDCKIQCTLQRDTRSYAVESGSRSDFLDVLLT